MNTGRCCKAWKAECLACVAGVDVEDYCMDNPTTAGCEGMFTIINNNYLIKPSINNA